MYLTRNDRTSVLIESISTLEELVNAGKVTAESAYCVVVAFAKQHQDWPDSPVAAPLTPAAATPTTEQEPI
jgi:hypothetical protein